MTLDEAIKHCEEIAMDKTNLAQTLWDSKEKARCKECADEHNQLAQWLIELKILRNNDVLDKIRAEINQYSSIWVQYTIKGHTDKDIEGIVEDVLKQAKEQVLDVIDKYRNEVSS